MPKKVINSIISKIPLGRGSINKRIIKVDELIRNYEDISKDERENLLKNFATDRNPYIRGRVSEVLTNNFNIISEDTRNRVMYTLGSDDKIPFGRTFISGTLDPHFREIPEDLREHCLDEFYKNSISDVRFDCATIIFHYYDDIPSQISGKIMTKLSQDPIRAVRQRVSEIWRENFKKLPEELRENLLKKFSEDHDKHIVHNVSRVVFRYFYEINENTREMLLKKLVRSKYVPTRIKVAAALELHFDSISDAARNEILIKFEYDAEPKIKFHLK